MTADPATTDPPDPVADAWEVLVLATLRLGRAGAEWDDARKRYLATNPYGEDTP